MLYIYDGMKRHRLPDAVSENGPYSIGSRCMVSTGAQGMSLSLISAWAGLDGC